MSISLREIQANEITRSPGPALGQIVLRPNVNATECQDFVQQGQRSDIIISQTHGVILVTTFLASCTECG